jgi:hypothetical protein
MDRKLFLGYLRASLAGLEREAYSIAENKYTFLTG